jgi:hypothetical protein
MRQHLYNFAHRVLPHDVHEEPSLWGIISSDRAASYLQMRWAQAAEGTDPQPAKGLIWIEPVVVAGITIRVIRMPPPESAAEAYYAAIARAPDGTLRYFVAERGSSGNAFMAEWRPSARVRCGDLVERAPDTVVAGLGLGPSQAAPWEVSSSAIAGMPYLASFIAAVVEEMRSDGANAQVKAGAGGFAFAPGRSPAKPAIPPALLLGILFVVVTLLVAIFVALR